MQKLIFDFKFSNFELTFKLQSRNKKKRRKINQHRMFVYWIN